MTTITIPLNMKPDCVPLKLKWIPAGRFQMNETIGSEQDASDVPKGGFEIIFSRGYWLGVYQVTQSQWQTVMGTNPSRFRGSNLPVETVSWQDAVDFCNRLNDTPLERPENYVFTLPTEAQWEYACKANSDCVYHVGDTIEDLSRVAWHRGNISTFSTQVVGQKEPNNWGLYDMLGNVMEWCFDGPTEYPDGTIQVDWVGALTDGIRNVRGGSVFSSPDTGPPRCDVRMYTGTEPVWNIGFRLCLQYEGTP